MNNATLPSYHQGFARNASEALNPHAWRGLRGYWDPTLGYTGGQTKDQAGGNFHAVHTDMAVNPADNWIPGPDGKVIDITGANDVLVVGDQYIFDDLVAFTWICKFYLVALPGDSMLTIRGDSAANSPWNCRIDFAPILGVCVYVADAGGGSGALLSDFQPVIETWYDFAFTFRLNSEVRMYINGAEDLNSPFATPLIGMIKNVGIGNSLVRFGNVVTGGIPLEGYLGRYAFYNRTLSHADIQEHSVNPHLVTQLRDD